MLNGLNICMYAVLLYTLDFKTLTPVVAKKEQENPCEHFEEGENVDPPCFHSFINFFFN